MLFEDDMVPTRRQPPRPNNENVLNLLPKESPPIQKTERYYSMHSPKVEAKTRTMATMGPAKTIVDPHNFTRKKDRSLPPVKTFHYTDQSIQKPQVPKSIEEPIHGLKTQTNFVKFNAQAAATSPTKKPLQREIRYTDLPGYGEPPKYLERVKEEIAQEQAIKREIMTEQVHQEHLASNEPERMSEEERQELLNGLRKRWHEIKREIGTMTLHIDIESIQLRKEALEMQLSEIEDDMEKLSKKYVFVEK